MVEDRINSLEAVSFDSWTIRSACAFVLDGSSIFLIFSWILLKKYLLKSPNIEQTGIIRLNIRFLDDDQVAEYF